MKISGLLTDDFDRALRCAIAGDVIELTPGVEYTTYGGWSGEDGYSNVASGVTIIATGATVLLIAPVSFQRQDHDLPILRGGANVKIIGGVWDCNHEGNPGWYTMGFRFHGKFEVHDAIIKGMSGSRRAGVESFAISSQGNTGGSIVDRVLVNNCKNDDPDDYVSGIYIGATEHCEKESLVRQCNVDLGIYGQFAYASNGRTLFVNCSGTAARFWYNDTGDTFGARLVDCKGRANYAVISCVAKDEHGHREVSVNGGEFAGERLIEWWENGGHISGGVVITGATWSGRYTASVVAPRGAIVVDNCKLSLDAELNVPQGSVKPLVI
jgi:hypothetical protein